jgi:hypothetical protein
MNFFFLKKFLKIAVFTKKKSNEFYFYKKFNEKLTKAKKNSNPACIFTYFHFIFTSLIFLKKTPKRTQCKIFAPIFFRCKKNTLHYTIFYFKTPHSVFFKHRFLFHTVYCAGVVFGNFKIHCTAMPDAEQAHFMILKDSLDH